jgi:hypothetical protein
MTLAHSSLTCQGIRVEIFEVRSDLSLLPVLPLKLLMKAFSLLHQPVLEDDMSDKPNNKPTDDEGHFTVLLQLDEAKSSEIEASHIVLNSQNENDEWDQVADTGKVQNRITIVGFILTLLVFTSTILLAYISGVAQNHEPSQREAYIYSATWDYINTIVPIMLGSVLATTSLLFLLISQELKKAWMFAFAEILLYLALASALAACLSKISKVAQMGALYQGTGHPRVGYLLALGVWILPLPLWLGLVYAAPIVKIYKMTRNRETLLGYLCAALVIMILSTVSFEVRQRGPVGWDTVVKSFAKQLVQPLFW